MTVIKSSGVRAFLCLKSTRKDFKKVPTSHSFGEKMPKMKASVCASSPYSCEEEGRKRGGEKERGRKEEREGERENEIKSERDKDKKTKEKRERERD